MVPNFKSSSTFTDLITITSLIMVNSMASPLYERVSIKKPVWRAVELFILFLAVCFLVYRLFYLNVYGFPWLLAFFCELCFTFDWVLTILLTWHPVDYKTYPQRLLQKVPELPPVDIFVTTADATLEHPLLVINTVLSLLAIDYPAAKLACYVSDDGCSSLLLYSLVEASNFAKLWVPFCKKYNIQVRAPFRYFSGDSPSEGECDPEVRREEKRMKDEYEELCRRIETAGQKSIYESSEYYAAFRNTDGKNHPAIIKILLETKEDDSNGLPNLIYVAREKRPNHPHHYKAGALNVLTRVSGVMTNAPFIVNVDCDMFANNPKIAVEAMCLLLGDGNREEECVFVQFPQMFYNEIKDDPFGNQLVTVFEILLRGMAGIQGPLYGGSGCFHRRKIIYTLNSPQTKGKFNENFGDSAELTKSAKEMLTGLHVKRSSPTDFSGSIQVACQVASCDYENDTAWGSKVGWLYGSMTEDILTGLKIHSKGWKSVLLMPDLPAFMGLAALGGPESLTQKKRWVTGVLEILFSKNSPFFAFFSAQLQFKQCLAYTWFLIRSLYAIPEMFYAILPAFAILTNSHFLPTVQDKALFALVLPIFMIYNLYNLSVYLRCGLSFRAWWNNLKIGVITSSSSYIFGVLSLVLKLLGLSETVFEVTPKDQSHSSANGADEANVGRFTFNESPLFLMGTTMVLLHLTALASALMAAIDGWQAPAIGEVFGSVWVLLCFLPYLKGLFGKGKYGIPFTTICKSAALALLFMHFFKRVV